MAGKDLARGRYIEKLLAPATHAFLGPYGVVIWNDMIDDENSFKALARRFKDPGSILECAKVGISAARF